MWLKGIGIMFFAVIVYLFIVNNTQVFVSLVVIRSSSLHTNGLALCQIHFRFLTVALPARAFCFMLMFLAGNVSIECWVAH